MKKFLQEFHKRLVRKEKNSLRELGTEIKRRRIKFSKTLTLVSGDSCSVSYLSKFENYQISVAPKYIEDICKRVNLTREDMDVLQRIGDYLDEAIKYFFYSDERIFDIVEKVQDYDNYKADLILIISDTFNLPPKHEELFQKGMELIGNYDDNEFSIFAYLYGVRVYDDGNIEDAIDIFRKTIELCNNEYLVCLSKYYLLFSYEKKGYTLRPVDYYEVINAFMRFDNPKYNLDIKRHMFRYLLKQGDLDDFEEELSHLAPDSELYIHFHTLKALVLNEDIDLEEIIRTRDDRDYFIKGFAYIKLRDQENSERILDLYFGESYDSLGKVFLRYTYLKHFKSREEQAEFISELALANAHYYNDHYLIHYYKNELIDYFKFKCYYKRALEIEEKFRNF